MQGMNRQAFIAVAIRRGMAAARSERLANNARDLYGDARRLRPCESREKAKKHRDIGRFLGRSPEETCLETSVWPADTCVWRGHTSAPAHWTRMTGETER